MPHILWCCRALSAVLTLVSCSEASVFLRLIDHTCLLRLSSLCCVLTCFRHRRRTLWVLSSCFFIVPTLFLSVDVVGLRLEASHIGFATAGEAISRHSDLDFHSDLLVIRPNKQCWNVLVRSAAPASASCPLGSLGLRFASLSGRPVTVRVLTLPAGAALLAPVARLRLVPVGGAL